MAVEVLVPVDAAGGGEGPALVDGHGFGVAGGVALMVMQVGERAAGAERVFLIPDADVVGVSAG